MAVFRNASLSAIPGFTAKRRPPNFGRRLAVLKARNCENKTAKPYRIFGGLHLLWQSSFARKPQAFRHSSSGPPSTPPTSPYRPLFGGNDRLVGGNWWEDRQESVCTCAREPGDHPRISTAPATRSKGERSFADPKPSSSCRSWPRRVFQPIPSDCESVVHRS